MLHPSVHCSTAKNKVSSVAASPLDRIFVTRSYTFKFCVTLGCSRYLASTKVSVRVSKAPPVMVSSFVAGPFSSCCTVERGSSVVAHNNA